MESLSSLHHTTHAATISISIGQSQAGKQWPQEIVWYEFASGWTVGKISLHPTPDHQYKPEKEVQIE